MTKTEVDAILKRMKIRMAELGMSKKTFYKESGISSASFSQWNTGSHQPTKKKLAKAAVVLNVSLEYLLTGTNYDFKNRDKFSDLDSEALKRMSVLTPDERLKVDAFIQGLLANRRA